MEEQGAVLNIVTGEKDDTIVVLFIGQIRTQEAKDLEELAASILDKPQTCVLMSFRDTTQFLPGAHRTFVQIQTSLRKAGKAIAMTGFRPDIKTALLQGAIVRDSEIFNNIPEARKALKERVQESTETLDFKKAA